MIHFKDWLQLREMSASGRRKRQAALGLAPPVADIFSRSTPAPWEVERLEKALKKSKKKKKRKKIEEAKKKQPVVHNDIDSFIKSVEMLAKDVWELDLLKKKKSAEEKMAQTAKRNTGGKKPEKPKPEEKSEKPKKPEKQDKQDKPKEKEDVAKTTGPRNRIKTEQPDDKPRRVVGGPERLTKPKLPKLRGKRPRQEEEEPDS
jgi:hypothetical protein